MKTKLALLLVAALALSACESTSPNDGANVRQAVNNDAPYLPAVAAGPTSAARPAVQVVNPLDNTRQGFWNTGKTR